MRRTLFALLAVIAVADAGGQDRRPSQYDRLLLPVHQSVAGDEGIWRVQWWVRNEGDVPVDVFPLALGCGLPGPGPDPAVFILRRPAVPPNHTVSCLAGDALPSFVVPPHVPVRGSVGAFLYVEKSENRLSVSGSVGWESPAQGPDPEHLQAVSETAFHRGTASVLPVPIAPNTRYALRVYALPETVDARAITIRLYEIQPDGVVRPEERLIATIAGELRLQDPSLAPCFQPCDIPDVPLAPAVYQLFDLPRPERHLFQSPMRVEISPASPNVRWWAMVSASHNSTQRIRLFSSGL